MKFLDQCKIYVKSGDGGAGAASLRPRKLIQAGGASQGMDRARRGGSGRTLILRVRVGPQTLKNAREPLLFDLPRPGQRIVRARGGDGGFGNAHSKPPTTRAPRQYGPGFPGEER